MSDDGIEMEHSRRPLWEAGVWLLIGALVGFVIGGLIGGLLGGPIGSVTIKSAEAGASFVNGVKGGFIWCGIIGTIIGAVVSVRSRFNPQTLRKLKRFHSIKRGYWSFLILIFTFVISLMGQFVVNNRALVVLHEGGVNFPAFPFSKSHTGKDFGMDKDADGQDYTYEVNYRELKERLEKNENGTVIMPFIPYSAEETDLSLPKVKELRIKTYRINKYLKFNFSEQVSPEGKVKLKITTREIKKGNGGDIAGKLIELEAREKGIFKAGLSNSLENKVGQLDQHNEEIRVIFDQTISLEGIKIIFHTQKEVD